VCGHNGRFLKYCFDSKKWEKNIFIANDKEINNQHVQSFKFSDSFRRKTKWWQKIFEEKAVFYFLNKSLFLNKSFSNFSL
jgi:hypothetical protein